jgi:hypothetical protein
MRSRQCGGAAALPSARRAGPHRCARSHGGAPPSFVWRSASMLTGSAAVCPGLEAARPPLQPGTWTAKADPVGRGRASWSASTRPRCSATLHRPDGAPRQDGPPAHGCFRSDCGRRPPPRTPRASDCRSRRAAGSGAHRQRELRGGPTGCEGPRRDTNLAMARQPRAPGGL